jgi:L-ascorbate metabolism protein UlaG (beta-lactamase superfamily)
MQNSLAFRWLGVAGLELTLERELLAVDPFLTRPSFLSVCLNRLQPDETLVKQTFHKCQFILVTHAHYDHLMDVPAIALKTGAPVYGSQNTCDLLKTCGVPREKVHKVDPGDLLELGAFHVKVLQTEHNQLPGFKSGSLKPVLKPPLRAYEYRMDTNYGFQIECQKLRTLVWNGKSPEGAEPADVLFVNAVETVPFYETLIKTVNPVLVIPLHWDNFFRPLSKPIRPFLRLTHRFLPPFKFFRLDDFAEMMHQVAPRTRVLIPEVFQPYTLGFSLPG